jgi:hypothetical protein
MILSAGIQKSDFPDSAYAQPIGSATSNSRPAPNFPCASRRQVPGYLTIFNSHFPTSFFDLYFLWRSWLSAARGGYR